MILLTTGVLTALAGVVVVLTRLRLTGADGRLSIPRSRGLETGSAGSALLLDHP
jgi:hypothetical protein